MHPVPASPDMLSRPVQPVMVQVIAQPDAAPGEGLVLLLGLACVKILQGICSACFRVVTAAFQIRMISGQSFQSCSRLSRLHASSKCNWECACSLEPSSMQHLLYVTRSQCCRSSLCRG